MSNSIHFFCPAIGAETVQVKQGEVSGMIKGSDFGSVYKAYLGIPYAAPPIGELRFKVIFYFFLLSFIFQIFRKMIHKYL